MVSEFRGTHLGTPFFVVLWTTWSFHYAGTTWALGARVFCCVFNLGPPGPNLVFVTLHVSIFSFLFSVWSVFVTLFSRFLLQMLKQLPVGSLAFHSVRDFGSLPLILGLITQLLIIVNRSVSSRRGVCIALGRFLFSQLLL